MTASPPDSSTSPTTTATTSGQDGDRLLAAVEADLGVDPSRWFTPDGYDNVALAVLDSIYSRGNLSTSVVNALNAYRAARRDEGADPEQDTAAQEASPVKNAWRGLPGQSSLLTWTYFLMLCGVPGVKADRMVLAYVSRALGGDADA